MSIAGWDLEMAQMIEELLLKYNSQDEVNKQRTQLFPDNWKIAANHQLEEFKIEVGKIVDLFDLESSKDSKDQDYFTQYTHIADQLKPVIDIFKKYLVSLNQKPIKFGFHYGWEYLDAVLKCLQKQVDKIERGWWNTKADVILNQIFGAAQLRLLSARNIHELIRGVSNYDENKSASRTFLLSDGTSIYSYGINGLLVGEDSCLSIYGCLGERCRLMCSQGGRAAGVASSWKNYVKHKEQHFKIFMQPHRETPQNRG